MTDRAFQSLQSVLVALVASASTVFISQAFFKPRTFTEQHAQLMREIVAKQYPYLKRMKMFAEVGGRTGSIVYTYLEPLDEEGRVHERIGAFTVPQVVYDTLVLLEWTQLKGDIEKAREEIDPEVYRRFEEVTSFYCEQAPSPTKESSPFFHSDDRVQLHLKIDPLLAPGPIGYYMGSPWSKKETLSQWLMLNEMLALRVERMLSLGD